MSMVVAILPPWQYHSGGAWPCVDAVLKSGLPSVFAVPADFVSVPIRVISDQKNTRSHMRKRGNIELISKAKDVVSSRVDGRCVSFTTPSGFA